MMHVALPSPTVALRDGQIWADSRNVAAHFGKNHKDVLRAIQQAHCSGDFRQRNFAPFKINDLTGESTSHVMMTKDGFAFIGFGFTGKKAGAFKEAWIAAFNAMEAELRAKPVRVKQHRRALPEPSIDPGAEPQRFEAGSDIAKDFLLAVRSARHRAHRHPGLSFDAALQETLEDIIARKDDPLAPTRGECLDWNHLRASQDLYRKLRKQGRDVKWPTRAQEVPPEEIDGRRRASA